MSRERREIVISIYAVTKQGERSRSLLLRFISPGEQVSREELVERSGLTYDQVRRQTKNLLIEGVLRSVTNRRKRYYSLAKPVVSR
ncbi:MAG: hypothetical protein HC866_19585 [Leptolyngbyaceae cyanobacterium RU_5_1]|nr:hypothetical protein [Leptolyngbyaceae cyanobacterium RU_5_1]